MNTQKNTYTSPEILQIILDQEISLYLTSNPPAGPGEDDLTYNISSQINNDPFKTQT